MAQQTTLTNVKPSRPLSNRRPGVRLLEDGRALARKHGKDLAQKILSSIEDELFAKKMSPQKHPRGK